MNSRKTNWKLIEKNYIWDSMFLSLKFILKFILCHVSFKKWSFNLRMKLLREIANFRSVDKLFQIIGVRYEQFFWPEHMFLKRCFSFKTKDLVFA